MFFDSLHSWAGGSPPISEELYKYVYEEFSLLLAASCFFPDFRPKYRAFTIIYGILYTFWTSFYVATFSVTVYLLRDDLATAALSLNVLIIHFWTIVVTVLINFKRTSIIATFRIMHSGFFDYGDGEEIQEMVEETRKSMRQKKFVIILQPIYLGVTALICFIRPAIDLNAGIKEESYVNDVYMLVPVPVWYPFRVTNGFQHYATTFSQVYAGSMNAAFFTGLLAIIVIIMQDIGLQLKILKYRIRKLQSLTYKQYREEGGKSLTTDDLFKQPDFLRLFNKNLNLCAMHHVTIITCFNHFQESMKWPMFVSSATSSIMICSTLLLFLVGGKLSTLAFGSALLMDEIVNTAMMCWQTEQVMELAASLHEELYNTEWKDLDKKAKKTLMIMIERTKYPLVLSTAITHTPLNWETFSKIINSAYSYFNLLNAAIQRDDDGLSKEVHSLP